MSNNNKTQVKPWTAASVSNAPTADVSSSARRRPHAYESSADDRGALPLGTVVRDRFELDAVIGEGSMGVVYRAVDRLHVEMEDRDPYVAIKVLSERFKRHPNALITLQREVRKAQVLAHENIIGVHTFDRDGGIVYMTMELLDGQTLRAIVAENDDGLPAAQVVPMVRGMARALAYAHANGIVHSDFKPGNVFLTRKNQIKVLDFGVARASGSEAREVSGMTPAYASPEMLEGYDPLPPDDVFALALVTWELLTGRHPFDQNPADETRLRALRPPPLPGLTRSQRKALMRALAPEREERHADANVFLKEFNRTSTVKTVGQVSFAATAAFALGAFLVSRIVEPEPSVAFADLPANVQQAIDDALREGDTALGFGDVGFHDALSFYSQAYDLHPGNQRAILGLEAVADRVLAATRDTDPDAHRENFGALYCQDYLQTYAAVTSACESALGAAECRTLARNCGGGR